MMNKCFIFLIVLLTSHSGFAQAVGESTGSQLSQNEAQQSLDFHNKVRNDVGTNPLTWSTELAAYAQEWADYLAFNNCAFEHRSGNNDKKPYGENIFWGSGSMYNSISACQSWYDEIKQYKHGPLRSDSWSVAGHYTQMVWHSTTAVGIGKASCANGAVIVVANYNPPGNYMGQKAYE